MAYQVLKRDINQINQRGHLKTVQRKDLRYRSAERDPADQGRGQREKEVKSKKENPDRGEEGREKQQSGDRVLLQGVFRLIASNHILHYFWFYFVHLFCCFDCISYDKIAIYDVPISSDKFAFETIKFSKTFLNSIKYSYEAIS